MEGSRARAQLIWDLAHRLASGALLGQMQNLRASPVRVELYQGWIHAIDWFPLQSKLGPAPPQGDERLQRLLGREEIAWRWEEGAERAPLGRVTPFHPAALLRRLVVVDGAAFRERVGPARLQLATPPHRSCIASDERPLLSLLGRPRALHELDAVCAPDRTAALLAFLAAMGAVHLEGELTLERAYATLELAASAPAAEVRRAYHRLARALHPDAHPEATDSERRQLAARFAAVTAAYHRLR